MDISSLANPEIAHSLRSGEFAVFATDTIYGIHTSALRPNAVEKLYSLKGRDKTKPFIVLISSTNDLKVFKIQLDEKTKETLTKLWPGKVSVILPCPNPLFEYLHRGKSSIAFRLPKKPELVRLLQMTGPLVSTSVNKDGQKIATTIEEAHSYFGDDIDIYINEGPKPDVSSTLIELKNGKINILRQGEEKITS